MHLERAATEASNEFYQILVKSPFRQQLLTDIDFWEFFLLKIHTDLCCVCVGSDSSDE